MDRLPHYRWLQPNAKELEPLVQHTVLAAMKGQPGARELANVAYGSVSFVIDESNLKGGRSRQKFWLGGAAPQTPQFLAGGAKPPQTPP